MIPESDQIFTEVELSTLEKAINETTVLKDGSDAGGGSGGNLGYDLYFHSRLWSTMCMFCVCATSKPFVCFSVS